MAVITDKPAPDAPAPAYEYQAFPKMLYGASLADQRIVADEAELKAAAAEGYTEEPPAAVERETAGNSEPVIDTEKVQLAEDLASAKELIGTLDAAGAKVAGERDEAREALVGEQAAHAETKGKLAAAEAEVARLTSEAAAAAEAAKSSAPAPKK